MKDQRKEKGEQTRRRILDAAQFLIEQDGVKSLSTRQIAKEAQVSQASLYHHFKGVDEVLLISMKEQAKKRMELFKQKRFTSPFEFLSAAFEASIKQALDKKGGGYTAMIERTRRDPVFAEQVKLLRASMQDQLRQDLQSYFIHPLEPKGLETVVFGFSVLREGMINQGHFGCDQAKQQIDELLFILCQQLTEQAL